ncbi:hypothetical protein P8452_02320 [Trifolium repens]|nr:hypothetical protein P8452_02320 [Trifolium repens]
MDGRQFHSNIMDSPAEDETSGSTPQPQVSNMGPPKRRVVSRLGSSSNLASASNGYGDPHQIAEFYESEQYSTSETEIAKYNRLDVEERRLDFDVLEWWKHFHPLLLMRTLILLIKLRKKCFIRKMLLVVRLLLHLAIIEGE